LGPLWFGYGPVSKVAITLGAMEMVDSHVASRLGGYHLKGK